MTFVRAGDKARPTIVAELGTVQTSLRGALEVGKRKKKRRSVRVLVMYYKSPHFELFLYIV